MAKEIKVTCPHCGGVMTVRNIDQKTADQFNKVSGVFKDFSKLMDDFAKRVDDLFKR
jgi:hypothetical protein